MFDRKRQSRELRGGLWLLRPVGPLRHRHRQLRLSRPEKILEAAKRAERDGAQRFGIVVAEKGVSKENRPEEWEEVLEAIRLVRDETDVEVDASLGILTEEEAAILADEGLNHYNHNIETSPRYFPEVVQTHTFEKRVETLRVAKDAGMDLCAGVILGMGESPTDRVDAAMALQDIGISSLPVNILNPVAGTPMAEQGLPDITTEEVVKTIAVYRLLHPESRVRLTGGREVNLDTDGRWPRWRPVLTASSLVIISLPRDRRRPTTSKSWKRPDWNPTRSQRVRPRGGQRTRGRRDRSRDGSRDSTDQIRAQIRRLTMDDIHFAVLGTGGIGRRTLEVSQHKDGLTAVAACDRNGVALDHDGLDVDELLAATEGNIASGPAEHASDSTPAAPTDDYASDGGAAAVEGGGVKQHGDQSGIVASEQGEPTETPIDDIIAESDAIDAVLLALPNLEHDFIPRVLSASPRPTTRAS